MKKDSEVNFIAVKVKTLVDGDNMAFSQDSVELEAGLLTFLPTVKNRSFYDHFRTAEARQTNSNERKLIESAVSGFNAFENLHKAKIISLAVALGGKTLELFKT